MSSIDLKTTPQIMSFFQDYSPTLNGTNPFANTTFTPYFVNCSNGFIDPIVSKFNNNGTSILQSCVLDTACQKAEVDPNQKGCTAVCGKLGDTHVLTFKSDLDEQQNRRLSITAYNVFAAQEDMNVALIKFSKSDSFEIHSGGATSFKSDLKEDTKNDEKKKLEDASTHFETDLKNIKPGATPQEGWSIGTGLAVLGAAAVGGAVVYGAQKVREKEQQNTTDAKSPRGPLTARFSSKV